MFEMKSFILRFFGVGSRLSAIEKMVLGSVKVHLAPSLASQWQAQVDAINKVQRLPDGVETNFYRMKSGRPCFDEALAFPNKSELLVAKVRIELPSMNAKLTAKVWCVNGYVFSIEYNGGVNYFEEAIGMDPSPELRLSCELVGDLSAS